MPTITDTHPNAEAPRFFFPFVGNALALDLINTDVVLRGRRQDLLSTPTALAAWWAAARRHHPDADVIEAAGTSWHSQDLLAAAKELRASLRVAFDAVAARQPLDAEILAPINAILRLGYHVLAPAPDGGVTARYGHNGASVRGTLFPIALSALRLLTQEDPHRLRACENPRCVALFYDTSKSATRRWCGEDCMNRARSAQRYAQLKADAAILPHGGGDPDLAAHDNAPLTNPRPSCRA